MATSLYTPLFPNNPISPKVNYKFSPNFSFQNPNRRCKPTYSFLISQFGSSFPKFCTTTASFVSLAPANGASVAQFRTYATLRELCQGHVPEHVLHRMEENGFVTPTEVQKQGLPILLSGCDCILHAQRMVAVVLHHGCDAANGERRSEIEKHLGGGVPVGCNTIFGTGKTLTYLLLVFSTINVQRSTVQALIVVPTRELGMQVTKVARMLAAKSTDSGPEKQKSCTVMALLDGGMLKRHRTWLKADPPTIVVATVTSLCQMLEKHVLDLGAMRVLIIDEVDFMFNSKQVSLLRKLLTSYSSSSSRQTVFASASIPQHRHFLYDCVQQKWTKSNVVHVHVNAIEPMPSCLQHRYMICPRNQRLQAILSLLLFDLPESAILFVNEQSEKSKREGDMPTTNRLIDFLKSSCEEFSNISLLEEDQNFNSRAASLLEVRKKSCYLIVATDVAARGVDLPETTHIYNFDMPKSAVHYLHRAGRAGRKPFSDDKCIVTSIIAPKEHFVLQRFEHELNFHCEEVFL